jgi:hypothetical protein
MKIAVLGAPGSGETELAIELAQRFRTNTTADGAMKMMFASAPPLMAALHANLSHSDDLSACDSALAQHRIYDLTLVCGLDARGLSDTQHDAGSLPREAVDSLLRAALARGKIDYAVIYGQGPERMDAALRAISSARGDPVKPDLDSLKTWQWACEKCSDPDCEHRMFTGQLSIGHR